MKETRNALYCDKEKPYVSQKAQDKTKEKETPYTYSLSANRGCSRFLFSGSITVEASFVGVLFLLGVMALLSLFQVLYGHLQGQQTLSDAALKMQCYGTKLSGVESMLEDKKVIGWDEEKKICFLYGREEVPFLGSRFCAVNWYQQMAYSDYAGESMKSDEEKREEYVYLAESGQVYHYSEDCVYLKPRISAHTYQQTMKLRNRSGEIYYGCEACKDASVNDGDTVYITPYGNRWHCSRNCSKLSRAVRRVSLSEIGGIPCCSKCGKR